MMEKMADKIEELKKSLTKLEENNKTILAVFKIDGLPIFLSS